MEAGLNPSSEVTALARVTRRILQQSRQGRSRSMLARAANQTFLIHSPAALQKISLVYLNTSNFTYQQFSTLSSPEILSSDSHGEEENGLNWRDQFTCAIFFSQPERNITLAHNAKLIRPPKGQNKHFFIYSRNGFNIRSHLLR